MPKGNKKAYYTTPQKKRDKVKSKTGSSAARSKTSRKA